MRALIVEDDITSSKLLEKLLAPHAECDTAQDGYSAMDAFRLAHEEGKPYDLICLDIMMPGMDGHEVLKSVRQLEVQWGIHGYDGVKVVMTTALDDRRNIIDAFRSQCEAYLVKPINKARLLKELKSLGLVR